MELVSFFQSTASLIIMNFSVNEDENQDPNEYLSNYDYLFEEGNPFKKTSSDENL